MFVNFEFFPTQKLDFHLKGSYTIAKGSFDTVHMRLPDEVLSHGNYDYSDMNNYSDLDQSYFELDFGGTMMVTDNVGVFTNFKYMDFTDDQPYIYGDETGKYYDVSAGVNLSL